MFIMKLAHKLLHMIMNATISFKELILPIISM